MWFSPASQIIIIIKVGFRRNKKKEVVKPLRDSIEDEIKKNEEKEDMNQEWSKAKEVILQ